MSTDRLVSELPTEEEFGFEQSLRPKTLSEFVGQSRVKENLGVYIAAAKKRGEALDHVLLSGGPGLGKTTLAGIIAGELGVTVRSTSGPAIDRAGDLVGLLTSQKARDVLFIDEIHRLGAAVEEYLYSAMEDYSVDIVIDQGPAARSVKMDIKRFTLVGATTREGLLSGPMRARFGILLKLDFYPAGELVQILLRSAGILGIEIDGAAAELIADRARGTPRIANRLLRRIRDLATVKADGAVDLGIAREGLGMMGIDERGLDEMDRKILTTVLRHGGAPVGLKTIAVSVGEEEDTIAEVYEPYLIQQGFMRKTARGRLASPEAYSHLDWDEEGRGQGSLFQ